MENAQTLWMADKTDHGLAPGVWTIKLRQTVEKDQKSIITTNENGEGNAIVSEQKIIVEDPVFALRQDQIVQRTPLPDTQGAYTDVVAHLVWNGCIDAEKTGLCLLLLKEDEIAETGETTIAQYQEKGNAKDLLTADITCLSEEKKKQTFSYVRLSRAVFEALAPGRQELAFLSHYRRVYIGDKPEMNLDKEGIFTVVLANRIPAYTEGVRTDYQVHAVALSGIYERMTREKKDWQWTELLSFDSWKFTVSGKRPDSFRDICKRLQEEQTEWMLRLPAPAAEAGMEEAGRRLQEGYLPLLYHTRLGDEGLCWGRSACVPVPVEDIPDLFAQSGDDVLCYDEAEGVFDVTYSLAYETGRMIAAQDDGFSDALFTLRLQAQELMDGSYARKIWNMEQGTAVQKLAAVLGQMKPDRLTEAFYLLKAEQKAGPGKREIPDENPQDIEAYVKAKKKLLYDRLPEETESVAGWLAKLLLLYPVDVQTLILHEQLLPEESIRFFFLDENWLKCLYDGAVSIGMYSSRQSLFNRLMREYLQEQTWEKLRSYRASLYGQPPSYETKGPYTGFLLRAAVTAYWPAVSVQAWDAADRPLAILRMEHLAEGILIAIFDGRVHRLVVSEPAESLSLRFDAKKYGQFLGPEHVLKICPSGTEGLASYLAQKAGLPAQTVSGAAFAREFLTMGERTVFGEVEQT